MFDKEEKIQMSTKTFHTTNPEQLIYQNELIKLTVLGGIKLEGLDRMRVTLKLEIPNSPRPPVRHNLDLYNESQTDRFIRKSAEKLETGTSLIAASLAELTDQLEQYRLAEQDKQHTDPYQPKALTAEERATAQAFLASEQLLERTNALIGTSGVVGEETNRLLMYLIFTSRKMNQPLHVVSLGSSGTGKTHLQEKVGELIPEEERLELTSLSENSFYYFGQRELKHKLILIEDLDGLTGSGASHGGGGAFYALRELQSKKRISKTVAHKNTKGETRTIHLVVEGPVSVAGCTTKEHIYEDNANRSFLLYLDESPEQDQRIMAYQRAISAGKVDTQSESEATRLLRNCQRILEPIKVVNPYAEQLALPASVFKPRRTNNHYLQFIEAVTFYHQRQREHKTNKETGELYIETTIADIEQANQLLKAILLRKSDTLTGACRNHFERLKQYELNRFTNRQISQQFRIPITTVKRYHLDLHVNGYLRKEQPKGSKAYHYQIIQHEEYQQLQARINTVLDETLARLEPSSPHQPSNTSGPVNPQTIKAKAVPAQQPTKRDAQAKKEGAMYTLKHLQQAANQQPFSPEFTSQLTGRSQRSERRYLKELSDQGHLIRKWENRQYRYYLPTT